MSDLKIAHDVLITQMTNAKPLDREVAVKVVDDFFTAVLHATARVMENAGYDDDSVNFLDSYADAWRAVKSYDQ